jgi:hypothetical protein
MALFVALFLALFLALHGAVALADWGCDKAEVPDAMVPRGSQESLPDPDANVRIVPLIGRKIVDAYRRP